MTILFLFGLCPLCGLNNSVSRCKSVSNRKQFEKTKPIIGKGKSKKAKGKMRVNLEVLRQGDLKKQSQFQKGQNGVKSISTMVYGDYGRCRQRKNKANSKPNTGLRLEIRSMKFEIRNKLNGLQKLPGPVQYGFQQILRATI